MQCALPSRFRLCAVCGIPGRPGRSTYSIVIHSPHSPNTFVRNVDPALRHGSEIDVIRQSFARETPSRRCFGLPQSFPSASPPRRDDLGVPVYQPLLAYIGKDVHPMDCLSYK